MTAPDLTPEQRETLAYALADCACVHPADTPFVGDHCSECLRLTDDLAPVVARMVAEAEQRGAARVVAAVEAAFDPGDLDCGRLGLPCTSVNPPDRWCRPCRIRAALAQAAPTD